jgi:hypothetical protein
VGTSKNPNLCVTLLQQNAHLRQVTDVAERKQKPLVDYAEPRGGKDRKAELNSAFVSVASLDIEIFRSPPNFAKPIEA